MDRRLRVVQLSLIALSLFATPWVAGISSAADAPALKSEEIEQLVAPIALYPDSLMSQVLMASTYPLEIVEAARWRGENSSLEGDALADALEQQSWDPSVKSLTAFPQVLTMMNDKLDWTQKLGDAFLAQQDDVLNAVQRLRAKAKSEGNLESNEQQKVTVEQPPANVQQTVNVEAPQAAPQQIITIQPASPQVVYVPTYNPTVVYGTWPYPSYPPYSYYPPGYVATSMISFGIGMAVGGALWGNCNWGWGGHSDVDIDIDRYNNFNRTEIKNNKWEHNSNHRKGVPYRDKGSQQRFGKSQPNAAARDAYRGHAEKGRRDIQQRGAGNVQRDLNRAERGQGVGSAGGGKRDGGVGQAKQGQGQKLGQGKQGQGQKVGQGKQGQGQRGQGQPGQNRPQQAQRKAPSGLSGMGNGQQVRRESQRGNRSMQSARGGGGGGGRGGGGGGRGGGGGGRRR